LRPRWNINARIIMFSLSGNSWCGVHVIKLVSGFQLLWQPIMNLPAALDIAAGDDELRSTWLQSFSLKEHSLIQSWWRRLRARDFFSNNARIWIFLFRSRWDERRRPIIESGHSGTGYCIIHWQLEEGFSWQ
jgi:hypothetical protein